MPTAMSIRHGPDRRGGENTLQTVVIMDASHHVLRYRLDARDACLIWISGRHDGVFVDPRRRKVTGFSSPAELREFARNRGIALVGERPRLHDLDKTAAWLAKKGDAPIDCDNLLAAWNLFADVSRSVDGGIDPGHAPGNRIHQKLFFGGATANTVLRPEQEPWYEPVWLEAEIATLRETLSRGLLAFRQAVTLVA
jgi:hypothetical protein